MFRFAITAFFSICVLYTFAQAYQSTTDVIYGENCFVQVNDKYTANGKKDGTGSYSWPQRSDAEICYYLRVPVGNAKMSVTLNTKANAVVRLKITDPETKELLYTNEAATSGSGTKTVQLMDGFKSKSDKWYRFALSSPAPSAISSIVKLEFNRESDDPVVSSLVFGAPSTHLWSTAPLDPMAPKGSGYDWSYQEVMYPSQYIRPATYVQSMATLGGYMGIQTGNIVLFSMWDDGDTDKDPYLPDYLKSTCMDSHPDIRIRRFGGEGTGVQSMFQEQAAHTWKPDTWVQFLFNARPEQVKVTIKGSKGQDSTFIRENTITTAWYKNADDPDWTYMATLRKSGSSSLISGWYSFLEDFAENGCDFTRAYYRNGYMRSAQSGKWYNVSHFTYGHTDGPHNGRRGRTDYGHGVTDLYENTYFMEQGGFFTKDHDSLEYAGIPLDQSCVDTINIQAKIDRVNQAIQKQARLEAAMRLNQTGEVYDMSKWQVIAYSDQSEEGDGDNGRAWQAIDGNANTYWRNKWKNGGVLYPHWIAMKAPDNVTISQIDLKQSGTYLYWPKHLVVHTSIDGEQWQVASDTLQIAKVSNPTITLPTRITSKYFKFEFVDSYGAGIYMNEITCSTDISVNRIMNYAAELVENAGSFDYFPINQTAPVKEAYADGAGNIDDIADAIDNLINNGDVLRYGNVSSSSHLATQRLYHIFNNNGYGNLVVKNGKLTICNATIDNALEKYKYRVDVTLPENNWIFVRVEGYNTCYMYNPGVKKYLDFNAEGYLSDKPFSMTPSYNAVSKTFSLRSGNKFLSIDPTSADEPIKIMTGSLNEGAQFLVYDNFYLTPLQEDVQPLLDECTDLAKFPSMVKLLGEYLNVEQGFVGSIPEGEERDYLTELYDNGNISIDKRAELYKAIAECKRVEFKPNEQVYRLKSMVEGNANTPYLTGLNTAATSFNAISNSNVAQIWSVVPKGEGYSLVTQNYALGRLPSNANVGINMSKCGSKDVGKYYLSEANPGKYQFATTQIGGIAYSAATAGKSELYGNEDANYQLEPVNSFSVSLQSSGLKGVNYAFDIIIPEELKVYVVDHIDNGTAYLLRVYDRLPAGEPAIIKGNSYEVLTLQIAAPTESNIAPNLLRGTYFAENGIKGTLYTLKTTDGGVFAKSAISNVAANSVYLLFDETDAPLGKITLDFSDEPCAINNVKHTMTNSQMYDLYGNKVQSPTKGHIYIQDGNKIKK